jgi:hypothetical protein
MRFRITLLLLASTSLLAGSPEEDEEVGVITLSHELPTAFYQTAPRSIRLALERTRATYCAGPREPLVLRDPPHSEAGNLLLDPAPTWLCAGSKLNFVRAVYINGYKSQFGAVCAAHTRGTIYSPVEWLRDPVICVPIGYDNGEKAHSMGRWPPWALHDREPE